MGTLASNTTRPILTMGQPLLTSSWESTSRRNRNLSPLNPQRSRPRYAHFLCEAPARMETNVGLFMSLQSGLRLQYSNNQSYLQSKLKQSNLQFKFQLILSGNRLRCANITRGERASTGTHALSNTSTFHCLNRYGYKY